MFNHISEYIGACTTTPPGLQFALGKSPMGFFLLWYICVQEHGSKVATRMNGHLWRGYDDDSQVRICVSWKVLLHLWRSFRQFCCILHFCQLVSLPFIFVSVYLVATIPQICDHVSGLKRNGTHGRLPCSTRRTTTYKQLLNLPYMH